MPALRWFFDPDDWQINYLFDLGFQGWLVHIGVISLTGTLLLKALPYSAWPLWWTSAMVVLSITLAILSRYEASRGEKSGQETRTAGWLHSAFTTIVGLLWGSGAIGAATANFEILSVYSLVLGGTALGAVSSQHSVPRSCFASIWTSMAMLALAHMLHDPGSEGMTVGLMILFYAIILSILSIRMFRFLSTNQQLTESLDDKVSELTVTAGELEKARHSAEDKNRAKSRFLSQASHDLRQPIHAIGLFTASMKATKLKEEQHQMVDSIEKSVESVTHLLGSMLDISRLELGGVVPRPTTAGLGTLIAGLIDQNTKIAERHGCTLRAVESTACIRTDAGLLATMAQNILSNAFKYAPGSQVLIGPRRVGGKLGLQICDTGPGIDPSLTEAIFQEYYRLEQSGAQEVEGMGLGLAIVQRLSNLLDLKVQLTSMPRKGTSILISGLEQVDATTHESVAETYAHPLSGLRICLIDSDPNIRVATVQLLERWGCIVEDHNTLPTVDQRCDIILTDLVPHGEIDAPGMIHILRGRAGWHIPIAVLTGHLSAETGLLASEIDAPVLHKPVSPAKLRATLTSLCLNGTRRSKNV